MRGLRKLQASWMVIAATLSITPSFGQSAPIEKIAMHLRAASAPEVCIEPGAAKQGNAALRLVCLQNSSKMRNVQADKAIIIGFVGGFVQRDDIRHPEVQFAAYLREAYAPAVHAEVFANHDEKHTLQRVLQLLSKNGDGVLNSHEKERAKIIIYGHSWGASQVVTLARDLGRLGIPVSLAVLVDSVHKPGHDDAVIPPNVQNVVNFYQTRGFIHGRSRILASDPERTNMIGNFQISYQSRQINCDNYPWIVRHLNKPHHEIENDPLVWEQIASLIDSELSESTSTMQASLPSLLK